MPRRVLNIMTGLVSLAMLLAGCLGPSQEDYDLATAVALETERAAFTPTRAPTETPVPPTATPSSISLSFEDPVGDVIDCRSGESIEGEWPTLDFAGITVEADGGGVALHVLFPLAQDFPAEVADGGLGWGGILMLDDGENPMPPAPELGRFSLGSAIIDAIWDGERFGERVFVRNQEGEFDEVENHVQISAEANGLHIKILPDRLVEGLNRAGFAISSPNGCDLLGIEFDWSAQPSRGTELTLDIGDAVDYVLASGGN